MANLMLGYPNRADGMTTSSGSWETSLPSSNLTDAEIWKAARTTDATLSSTKFGVDLTESKVLRVFGLINHNLSSVAKVRLSLGSTPLGSDVYSSGWVNAWQITFDNLFEWESASWWIGSGDDEYLRSPYVAFIIADDFYTARYITIEIDDTANTDGYIQVGRFFAGNAFQPTINMKYGIQDNWVDLSSEDMSESGTFWGTERRRLREVSFILHSLTVAEAGYMHEMQRLLGTVNEILYVPYPDDLDENQRYGFLGRVSELSPIEYPWKTVKTLPLKIREMG